LATPALAKPLTTFEDLAKVSSSLNVQLRNNSFQSEYMKTAGNKNLRTLFERSSRTGNFQGPS
jgi:hypothetical protein